MEVKIHDCNNDNTIFNTKKWVEYTEEVKVAIERDILKKPVVMTYELLIKDGWKFACPYCGSAVGINNRYELADKDPYCSQCGQRLDWS